MRLCGQYVNIPENPIDILHYFHGHYLATRDSERNIISPLVGLIGTYTDVIDGVSREMRFVSDEYYNTAVLEQYPDIFHYLGMLLIEKHSLRLATWRPEVIVGMPMGGILLAHTLAKLLDARVIFAEKRPEYSEISPSHIISRFTMDRHDIRLGERVMIVDDVCTSYSTIKQALDILELYGAHIMGIICIVDRSTHPLMFRGLPLSVPMFSLIQSPATLYRQDHPHVRMQVERNNVFWRPKDHWRSFMPYITCENV